MATKSRRSKSRSAPRGYRRGVVLVGLLVLGAWTWNRVWNLNTPQPLVAGQPSSSLTRQAQPEFKPAEPQQLGPKQAEPQQASPPSYPEPDPQPLPKPELQPSLPGPVISPSSIPSQMVGTIFRRLSAGLTDQKYIALTFDDGPWPAYTEEVLAVLSRYAVPATFFWLGENVQQYPQIAQQVVEAGHAVGNHTWSHATHTLSPQEAEAEIARTAEIIRATTGVQTQMFRPPGGHKENGLNAWARANGYAVVMWSVQTEDWQAASVGEIVEGALGNARPGTVMLLHDGGNDRSKTVEALPQIIEGLQADGYRLVSVPDLLRVEAVKQ